MSMKRTMRQLVRKFGYDIVRFEDLSTPERFPLGHFYSVIPSIVSVTERASEIFSRTADVNAVDLDPAKQIEIMRDFNLMMKHPHFYSPEKRKRFDIDNDYFSYDDAPILHCMMRRLRPKRIIEIGSGHSSACMLDTSEFYLNDSVEFTFIDVNCSNLRRVILETDLPKVRIYERPIQEVDLAIFSALQANDLLFIDSSHVMKTGSDLQTIFFKILPMLAPGVCIHFHDIQYPFEYPMDSIKKGFFWNESYVLRAFLMYNREFEVTFWLNYLINMNSPEVTELLKIFPLSEWDRRFNNGAKAFSSAGGSIYITKMN
jgi:predicted O-methyltransferase YrrM